MNACDWPHVLAVLNLSLCLSSRFAAVHKGRVSSKRTNWKHFFSLVMSYCEIPHLTMLGITTKMLPETELPSFVKR